MKYRITNVVTPYFYGDINKSTRFHILPMHSSQEKWFFNDKSIAFSKKKTISNRSCRTQTTTTKNTLKIKIEKNKHLFICKNHWFMIKISFSCTLLCKVTFNRYDEDFQSSFNELNWIVKSISLFQYKRSCVHKIGITDYHYTFRWYRWFVHMTFNTCCTR